MKCKVCGADSGRYVLCRDCNEKKEQGLIIKCDICNEWHYKDMPCRSNRLPEQTLNEIKSNDGVMSENETEESINYLYELKKSLLSSKEIKFYEAIIKVLPKGYLIYPQINLATFIERTDNARFHNELFRNVDFLITDNNYKPCIVVEINDQTHLTNERKQRDEKVKKICEEAGIQIINLWTTYGVNSDYISKRIREALSNMPIKRIHHSVESTKDNSNNFIELSKPNKKKSGCYIATCVYGTYDCSNVWVLRRFRDNILAKSFIGRTFINLYYAVSPHIVDLLGDFDIFKKICKYPLDKVVKLLMYLGFEDTPYID